MSWRHRAITVALAGVTASMATPGLAQNWSGDQLEVWAVIQAQWQAAMEKDATWPERFLHESFLGWGNENPAPRDKASTDKWTRYGMENSTTLMQELSPIGIVVHDNTAVAHYFYSTASENRKGERETTHGRYTDVLVRDRGTWRFLAWHGGDDPDNDD
ncbi:MAG: nuclear transport factor 2 family protein [Gemmatimonadota bacterium]|nr:MAG: nuclear transport factor 2 family protein [Gemmatimonadota bacterium]